MTDDPSSPALVDRQPPAAAAQEKSGKKLGFLIGMAVCGAFAGYFGVRFMDDLFLKPEGVGAILLFLLSIPLAWLLAVGWHELGHIVGGWMVGGRFLLWVVGPIMLRQTPSGLQWSRNRSVNVGGGMAICMPTEVAKVTPPRMAVMILGGPVSSLVLVAVAFALVSALRPLEWTFAHNLLTLSAILSLLVFVATILPFVAGGFKSDGKRARDLLKGDAHSEQEAALLILTTQGLGGLRPADYDPALIDRALSLRDGSMFDLYGWLTAYYYHADRGQFAQAQECLDEVLAGEAQLVPYLKDVVRYEYAWLLATHTNFVDSAQAWLDSAGKLDFDPATQLRAEAAVSLAGGDNDQAREKIAEARHALEHRSLSPVKNPFAVVALDQLEAMLATS